MTVLAYDDTERSIPLVVDGRTLVTDDQLFFGGLNKFPKVTQHVELQFLHRPLLRDLYLVDTPGVFTEWGGRPYDYKSVMLWFARQAEVVLYFFDPLKPGVIHESVVRAWDSAVRAAGEIRSLISHGLPVLAGVVPRRARCRL